MEIVEEKLVIKDELANDDIDKLKELLNNGNFKEIIVENDNLSSGVIQLLLCSSKPIKTDSEFFKKLIESVAIE